MTPRANSTWIGKVSTLLSDGYGSEDIAVILGCSVDDVRREIQIRREEGSLKEKVQNPAYGRTAQALMRRT